MKTTDLMAEMTENVNKYGSENMTTYLMVQAIEKLRHLSAENEALRMNADFLQTAADMSHRTSESLLRERDALRAQLPDFQGLPKRKLEDLLAEGFRITGYAIKRDIEGIEPERGFITVGGLVGWWRPGMQAQAKHDEAIAYAMQRAAADDATICALRAQVEALTEAAAKVVYEQWAHLPGYAPWVERGNSHKQEDARMLVRRAIAGISPQPLTRPAAPDKGLLADLIREHMTGVYHCGRVWEAWSVGTMSEDDFSPYAESDSPDELADAILAMLAAAPQLEVQARRPPNCGSGFCSCLECVMAPEARSKKL